MKKKQLDGFSINIFPEKDYWLAHLVELPNVSASGDTLEETIYELGVAWNMVKEWYIENGEPIPTPLSERKYNGQFNVRIDKRVHKALAEEALREGVKLNTLVSQKLAASTRVGDPPQKSAD